MTLPASADNALLSPPQILLVEDDPAVCSLLTKWVAREGGRLDVSHSLKEAEERLAAREYDLLLCDIHLPDGESPDLVARIGGANAGLPVILLTGEPSVATAIRSVELRVAAYLVKPPQLDELRALVGREVAAHRNRRLLATSRRRLQQWDRDLAQLEGLSTGPAISINHLQVTLRHFVGVLNELEASVAALAADNTGRAALTQVDLMAGLRRTVQVLEGTRRHFASKELGDLRKDLGELLQRIDGAATGEKKP